MTTDVKKPGFTISLRTRLFAGFLMLSLPLVLLMLLLLPKVNSVVSFSDEIYGINLSGVLDTQIYQSRDLVAHWLAKGDPADKIKFRHTWDDIYKTKAKWENALIKLNNHDLLKDWMRLKRLYEPLHSAQLEIMNAPRNPETLPKLHQALENARYIGNEMVEIIDGEYSPVTGQRSGGLYDAITAEVADNIQDIHNNLLLLKRSAYVLLTLAILLTLIVPVITLRTLEGPVDHVIEIAERIAAGERDINIETHNQDRLGKMLLSLKSMQYAIKENEEKLRTQEEKSRELFENLVNSSKKFSYHSSKVASGDLRERLELDKEDVLHDLGKDLNLMTDGLASITSKITQVSNELVIMVENIITAANEQTEGINSQASAINEISASLEEIDKSSKQTMNKAQSLREVAKSTYEQGKLGSESVEQSIHGIKASEEKMKLIAQTILDLSTHTQQIGEITAVVNTLAQQSKMLALNAAIEASKAGEAGKGFAAVATEVRNLAEQSEQSTVQVQKILEDIRRTTEKAVTVTEEGSKSLGTGIQLIEKAGEVIRALTKMINDASIASQHIEVAIRQEGVGIEQIVESMNEINRTTMAFSGGIKEMMDFIHNLDEIARHLKDDVNIYKV